MAKIDKIYNRLLTEIVDNGDRYLDPNRKGVYRYQIDRFTFEHDMSDGFPILTTKNVHFKSVIAELLWILRGQTHIKHLHKDNCRIWDKDALNYGKGGELGRVYGYQLRKFGGSFDQLQWIIDTMINNPMATKKTVTYINPNDKEFQALTPCHTGFKILMKPVGDKYEFRLQWEQDSVDTFLG